MSEGFGCLLKIKLQMSGKKVVVELREVIIAKLPVLDIGTVVVVKRLLFER